MTGHLEEVILAAAEALAADPQLRFLTDGERRQAAEVAVTAAEVAVTAAEEHLRRTLHLITDLDPLTIHRQRRSLMLRELGRVRGRDLSGDAQDLWEMVRDILDKPGCAACPVGCRECSADRDCECRKHTEES